MKTNPAATGENVRSYYENFMYDSVIDQYYENSDFHNFGLWDEGTHAPSDACRVLMRTLVSLTPPLPSRVLEVGCGKGATTRELRAHWPAAEITAIDVSSAQLETCRKNCPDASFVLMDACEMTFEESSFDLVISVEAAFHFPSRRKFLNHAKRVLKPGGCLVLQDVLHHANDAVRQSSTDVGGTIVDRNAILPSVNYLSKPDEYETLLREVGFANCLMIDVTDAGPRRFYSHFLSALGSRQRWTDFDPEHIRMLRLGARVIARDINYCLLIKAEKS